MGGEFNTYLQIAGHFSGNFNTVPEVSSLRWTGTKSLQHVKGKKRRNNIADAVRKSLTRPQSSLGLSRERESTGKTNEARDDGKEERKGKERDSLSPFRLLITTRSRIPY